MIKHVPNILTIIRIILVPVFVYFTFFSELNNNILLALIIFIIASLSDLFDGLIARKYKVISDFGKIMDPLADKLLVISALFALLLKFKDITYVIFAIIVLREVAVTLLRKYYTKRNIVIAANWWGKVKTVLQMTGIIISLTYYSFYNYSDFLKESETWYRGFIRIFFWVTAIVTVFSGINYLFVKKAVRGKK